MARAPHSQRTERVGLIAVACMLLLGCVASLVASSSYAGRANGLERQASLKRPGFEMTAMLANVMNDPGATEKVEQRQREIDTLVADAKYAKGLSAALLLGGIGLGMGSFVVGYRGVRWPLSSLRGCQEHPKDV